MFFLRPNPKKTKTYLLYERTARLPMRRFHRKFIDGGVLDVDKATKSVKIAISSMETIDRDKEIIGGNAWTKTIREKGPKGSNEVWHMIDHGGDGMPSLLRGLGKFKELSVQGEKLIGISVYKDTFLWREHIWQLYEDGDINQHSAAFLPVTSRWVDFNGKRAKRFDEVEIFEGSAVLWGAHPDTPTMQITLGKRLGLIDDNMTLPHKMERLIKSLKTETLNDDTKSFLLIELLKLQQEIQDNEKPLRRVGKSTKPATGKGIDWNMVALEMELADI